MSARDRRAILIAAWLNGALVGLVPFAAVLTSGLNDDAVRPQGVSSLPPILNVLPLLYVFGALGALAGWRTQVHARAYVERNAAGWLATLEPAALGLAIALFLLGNGIRSNP